MLLLNSVPYLAAKSPWSLSTCSFTPHWNVLCTLHIWSLKVSHFSDADCPVVRPSKFAFLKSNSLTLLSWTLTLKIIFAHTMLWSHAPKFCYVYIYFLPPTICGVFFNLKFIFSATVSPIDTKFSHWYVYLLIAYWVDNFDVIDHDVWAPSLKKTKKHWTSVSLKPCNGKNWNLAHAKSSPWGTRVIFHDVIGEAVLQWKFDTENAAS